MKPLRFRQVCGFTLVEMLVAMGVFVMLLISVSILVGSTSSLTSEEQKHLEADAQARRVFDRMGLEFTNMVKRPDLDSLWQSNPGNDQMAFFSETTGYFPSGMNSAQKGTVSLVGYLILTNTNTQQPELIHLSKGLPWSGVSLSGSALVYGTTSVPSQMLTTQWPLVASGKDPDYQVLSDQVYRMEMNFLLKGYTLPNGTQAPPVLSVTPWDTRQNHSTLNGMKDVRAIVVALAILDDTSRKIVLPTQYPDMIRALPDATGTNILKTWSDSHYLTQSNIPATAAAQLRIYQRYFYLNSAP